VPSEEEARGYKLKHMGRQEPEQESEQIAFTPQNRNRALSTASSTHQNTASSAHHILASSAQPNSGPATHNNTATSTGAASVVLTSGTATPETPVSSSKAINR
jgi:hypothetical protein